MEPEGEDVDHQRNDDQPNNPEAQMSTKLDLSHPQIAKLVPEILNSVQTNECSAEHANPLDTAHAADGDARHKQPQTPLRGERVMPLVVKLRPAKDRGEGEEQQHTIQQDEPADSRIAVLKQHHSSNQPHRGPLEMQLPRRKIRQRHAHGPEGRIEQAHIGIIQLFGVRLTTLKLEGSIVACQVARQTDQHLAEGRVDVEVEFALEVVGAEFAEVCLVPGDDGGEADLPHAREEGERGEEEGREEEFEVVEGGEDRIGLQSLAFEAG